MSHIISIHLHISQYTSTYLNISQWISISQIFQHIPTNFWQFHHISTTWIFPFLAVFPAMRWYSLHQHRWGGGSKDQGRVFFLVFLDREMSKAVTLATFLGEQRWLSGFLAMFLVVVQVEITGFGMEILIFFTFLGVEFYQIAIGDQHTKTSAIDISLHIWMLYGFVTWAIPVYPQMANLWKMM